MGMKVLASLSIIYNIYHIDENFKTCWLKKLVQRHVWFFNKNEKKHNLLINYIKCIQNSEICDK